MEEHPDFEQNYFSRTSKGIYKSGHDSNILMKWLAFYENAKYYDLRGSIL